MTPFDVDELTATVDVCSGNARPTRRLVGFPTSAVQTIERRIGKIEW